MFVGFAVTPQGHFFCVEIEAESLTLTLPRSCPGLPGEQALTAVSVALRHSRWETLADFRHLGKL